MSLVPGMRLGPHEILGAIGAGGMGEVRRARDTRLDRTVAIKVLPPECSLEAERRARVQHEARAIAALARPHICALYDIGESIASSPESRVPSPGSVHYLVMEHIQGDTLAARLERGPLPLEQAPTVGTEIADALATARRLGIIRRDLKPGNLLLKKAGAKLLDFGLAKLKRTGRERGGRAQRYLLVWRNALRDAHRRPDLRYRVSVGCRRLRSTSSSNEPRS